MLSKSQRKITYNPYSYNQKKVNQLEGQNKNIYLDYHCLKSRTNEGRQGIMCVQFYNGLLNNLESGKCTAWI